MKKSHLILFAGIVLILGIFAMGCSSSTDESPLELYVTEATCDTYYVNESTTPVVLKVSLKCEYNGSSSTSINGVFVNYISFLPEDVNGNTVSGAPSTKIKESLFIDKNSSTSITWDNFVVDWPALKTYCDSTGSGSLVYHVRFDCEDSAGNAIEADGYVTLNWTSKP